MKLATILGALSMGAAITAMAVTNKPNEIRCHPEPHSFNFTNALKYPSPPPEAQLTTGNQSKKDLDMPRMVPYPDSNNFEWWYFHAFNPANVKESIAITFVVGSNMTTPTEYTNPGIVSNFVLLSYNTAKGEQNSVVLTPEPGNAGQATVVSFDGCAISTEGDWSGTGARFFNAEGSIGSSPKQFTVEINAPRHSIHGRLFFNATAPPHLPCTADIYASNQTLQALSNIGYTNALPDASVNTDFTFNSRSASRHLSFRGAGYHDHVWGDLPFRQSVRTMFTGHIRAGPYAIVWRYSTSIEKELFASGYVAKDGVITYVDCIETSEEKGVKAAIHVETDEASMSVQFLLDDGKVIKLAAKKSNRVQGVKGQTGEEMWTGDVEVLFGDAGVVGGEERVNGTGLFWEFRLHN
ncbi:hypothetical protein B0J11DRAFT_602280 [Dendryphion nanum]|uniref:Hydroxyneurosporene synthase n=1 Tax=Dendryphion nanum TaxID=256645 RepID=A0A9P9E157_9PLEO|nr:hypothetical protein B0J11DRAFT_602280 [Dendryphion nanum]